MRRIEHQSLHILDDLHVQDLVRLQPVVEIRVLMDVVVRHEPVKVAEAALDRERVLAVVVVVLQQQVAEVQVVAA